MLLIEFFTRNGVSILKIFKNIVSHILINRSSNQFINT